MSGKGGKPPSSAEMMTSAMTWSPDTAALRGRVALVAGATSGAGRGIAAALGEAGATVVCTGCSTRSRRSQYDRAETIEETAELVTQLGGIGVALAVDHLDAEQVRGVADHIRNQQRPYRRARQRHLGC